MWINKDDYNALMKRMENLERRVSFVESEKIIYFADAKKYQGHVPCISADNGTRYFKVNDVIISIVEYLGLGLKIERGFEKTVAFKREEE